MQERMIRITVVGTRTYEISMKYIDISRIKEFIFSILSSEGSNLVTGFKLYVHGNEYSNMDGSKHNLAYNDIISKIDELRQGVQLAS